MTKQQHPHSRSVYPRPIVGQLTVTKLKRALSNEAKSGEALLDHTECSLCMQDFLNVSKELTGGDNGVSGQVFVYNSVTNTRVTIHSDSKVVPGTVVFWSKYEGDSNASQD